MKSTISVNESQSQKKKNRVKKRLINAYMSLLLTIVASVRFFVSLVLNQIHCLSYNKHQ
jgi:hypothetical protein